MLIRQEFAKIRRNRGLYGGIIPSPYALAAQKEASGRTHWLPFSPMPDLGQAAICVVLCHHGVKQVLETPARVDHGRGHRGRNPQSTLFLIARAPDEVVERQEHGAGGFQVLQLSWRTPGSTG